MSMHGSATCPVVAVETEESALSCAPYVGRANKSLYMSANLILAIIVFTFMGKMCQLLRKPQTGNKDKPFMMIQWPPIPSVVMYDTQ